jgi:hypothetical protein
MPVTMSDEDFEYVRETMALAVSEFNEDEALELILREHKSHEILEGYIIGTVDPSGEAPPSEASPTS